MCATTLANEFARYKRVIEVDKDLKERYNESASNYSYLMSTMIKK